MGRRRWGDRLLSIHAWAVYLFLYAPILVLVVFSFNDSRFSFWRGFTLRWYAAMFQNHQIMRALENSLVVAGWTMLAATLLGTLTAFVLVRHRFPGKSLLEALVYVPIILPSVIMGVSLLATFVLAGLRPGRTAIILGHVAFAASFATVAIRARLVGFDRNLERAAMDLGAGRWQTFRHVTLPLVGPGILAGALLAFTLSLDDVVITFFTAGPGSTTLPLYIFSAVRLGVSPEINALSTLILVVTAGVLILADWVRRWGVNHVKPAAGAAGRGEPEEPERMGGDGA
ncbi:MAG: ABC transporter permease [Thermaerobacter sp.]|nr:spermidine/putrescine ABC transporter permease PotC [Bacillota bacterium]REJ38310.1 MAG: spermidine/putrescine ABC transporter permease PotC [Bacillota bacterium]